METFPKNNRCEHIHSCWIKSKILKLSHNSLYYKLYYTICIVPCNYFCPQKYKTLKRNMGTGSTREPGGQCSKHRVDRERGRDREWWWMKERERERKSDGSRLSPGLSNMHNDSSSGTNWPIFHGMPLGSLIYLSFLYLFSDFRL